MDLEKKLKYDLKIRISSKPINIPKKCDSPILNKKSIYDKFIYSIPKYGSLKENYAEKYSECSDIPNNPPVNNSYNNENNKRIFLEKFAKEILKSHKLSN
jgi:hypothetical protein